MSENNSFKFHQGMAVAHVSNLKLKMDVKEIKFTFTGNATPDNNSESGYRKENARRIDGIVVQWWQTERDLRTEKFHSMMLVPWDIARMGQEIVDQWIQNTNKIAYEKVNSEVNKEIEKVQKYRTSNH